MVEVPMKAEQHTSEVGIVHGAVGAPRLLAAGSLGAAVIRVLVSRKMCRLAGWS